MGTRHAYGIESTAAILRHPLHPLLVPLPITAFVAVLCTDLVHHFGGNAFWAQASYWLLIAGVVTGLVAALAGFIDFLDLPGVRSLEAAQVHAMGNITVIVMALCNLGLRWHQPTHMVAWYIWLSAATVGLLALTGWLGGSLAYKHRIGQIAPEHGGRTAARSMVD